MASVKLKFRPSKVAGKEGSLYFQIIHERVIKQINTKCKVLKEDWIGQYSRIDISNVMIKQDMNLINRWDRVRFELKRLDQIAKHKEKQQFQYTAQEIVIEHISFYKSNTLFGFTLQLIDKLKQFGNIANANNYFSMIVSFMTFRRGEDIELKFLSSDVLEAYEAFLKQKDKGLSINTISFYMRTLRATFNRAVEKGLVPNKALFKRVRTRVERTAKRAMPLSYVAKLKKADLDEFQELAFARDLFLFSFYTRGMSFVDIAYLKKRALKNGEFTYRRSKTGQTIRVAWEQCMEDIVQRYTNTHSEYLLPIITNPNRDARQQYLEMRDRVNRNLKKVAPMVGIAHNITMYVARHSWASAAKMKNISISIISEALGHDSETTTRIYLTSLDTVVIDDANRLIIESI